MVNILRKYTQIKIIYTVTKLCDFDVLFVL